MPKKDFKSLLLICIVLMIVTMLCGAHSSLAFKQGKTYDQSNYQEIEDHLVPPVQKWIKEGEIILATGTLDFELPLDESYQKLSEKNEGKYDINADGVLVHKDTGKQAEFVLGNPFPTIDPKDPKAGAKILDNFCYTINYRLEGSHATGVVRWHSPKGLEREILSREMYLYYQNRLKGPIKNLDNYLIQQMIDVPEPFDLRGTVLMTWTYADARTDISFAYVPMLRRVRRVPASSRSDPWIGSDFCVDDVNTWSGKNANVKWKLAGDGKFYCAFGDTTKVIMKTHPNGSIERTHFVMKRGYEVPGWTGAGHMPANASWILRDCWVVEGIAKDPYYNYGKMIFYVDKENYTNYYKEIYNQAGEYWKTLVNHSTCYVTPEGESFISLLHALIVIDDKSRHASTADVGVAKYQWFDRFRLPIEEWNEQWFTESNMRQLSK